jgi:hypothetical protein
MNHSIPENLQVERISALKIIRQKSQKSTYYRRLFVHSDGVIPKKGQKSPIIKSIIMQYNIIATKNQFVNTFLEFF